MTEALRQLIDELDELAVRDDALGHLAYVARLAYEAGQAEGAHRAVTVIGGLDKSWQPLARLSHDQSVAARIAEMETLAAQSGRPPYHGGPVDWETGRPLT